MCILADEVKRQKQIINLKQKKQWKQMQFTITT